MPDWLMALLGFGAFFFACVGMAAMGLSGRGSALGCGAIIFIAAIFWTLWKSTFGAHALEFLIASVALLIWIYSGYADWKSKRDNERSD